LRGRWKGWGAPRPACGASSLLCRGVGCGPRGLIPRISSDHSESAGPLIHCVQRVADHKPIPNLLQTLPRFFSKHYSQIHHHHISDQSPFIRSVPRTPAGGPVFRHHSLNSIASPWGAWRGGGVGFIYLSPGKGRALSITRSAFEPKKSSQQSARHLPCPSPSAPPQPVLRKRRALSRR